MVISGHFHSAGIIKHHIRYLTSENIKRAQLAVYHMSEIIVRCQNEIGEVKLNGEVW